MSDLVLSFAQHFFLANIIDPQSLPYTCDQSALESKKRNRDVIYLRLCDVS
jgi:hypothetical protein